MTKKHNDYWFPVKSYGYGWGLPVKWQGWLVLVLFLLVNIVISRSHFSSILKLSIIIISTILLVLVCWLKGEKQKQGLDRL